MPKAVAGCLSAARRPHHPAARRPAPRARARHAPRTSCWPPYARADAGRQPVLLRRRRQQPRRRRRRLRRHRRARRDPRRRPRRAGHRAAGRWSPSPPASPGTPSSRAPSARAGSASRRSPGIPGSVGATPVQNVGAYGQEVADTVASVRCWDRVDAGAAHLRRRRLRLRLPHQPVQAGPGPVRRPRRHLPAPARRPLGAPVRYAELARTLGVEVGARAPLAAVREAVLGAAPRQGHGARRRRPRHLERRARSSPTRSWSRARPCPTARRAGSSPTAP